MHLCVFYFFVLPVRLFVGHRVLYTPGICRGLSVLVIPATHYCTVGRFRLPLPRELFEQSCSWGTRSCTLQHSSLESLLKNHRHFRLTIPLRVRQRRHHCLQHLHRHVALDSRAGAGF